MPSTDPEPAAFPTGRPNESRTTRTLTASASARGERIATVYASHAHQVEHKVQAAVPGAPQADVAEACGFAWMQLLTHPGVDLTPAPVRWLATTAIRETWRLGRQGLAGPVEPTRVLELVPERDASNPSTLAEQHERVAQLQRLPRRRRRFLWLQALGLSHEEMARLTGDSQRTVERQIRKAREGLRRADQARDAQPRHRGACDDEHRE